MGLMSQHSKEAAGRACLHTTQDKRRDGRDISAPNNMLWPGSITPIASRGTPATAKQQTSPSRLSSICLHDAARTMSSIPTYVVLATASLSVTYLAFMLYSAYGFAAFKAAAPFVGTVTLVFGESFLLASIALLACWLAGALVGLPVVFIYGLTEHSQYPRCQPGLCTG